MPITWKSRISTCQQWCSRSILAGKINEWRNDAGRNPRVYPNTDWQDHAFRDVNIVQNHNISVTGGTETVRYNMSLGYIHNPGMTTGTQYSRYQMRSNLEVDIKPWITAGMNIYGFIDSSDTSADNATNGGDVVFGYGGFNTVPGMNLYDKETGTYGGIQNPEEQNVSNAIHIDATGSSKTSSPTRPAVSSPRCICA